MSLTRSYLKCAFEGPPEEGDLEKEQLCKSLLSRTPCRGSFTGLIIIGQYKAITAPKGFNRRIVDEFQEAQDNQFWGFWALKFCLF